MVGRHYRLNGQQFEQAPGDGEGQRSLACCGSWGCKQSDTTEQLNNKSEDAGSAGMPTRSRFFSSKILDTQTGRKSNHAKLTEFEQK